MMIFKPNASKNTKSERENNSNTKEKEKDFLRNEGEVVKPWLSNVYLNQMASFGQIR